MGDNNQVPWQPAPPQQYPGPVIIMQTPTYRQPEAKERYNSCSTGAIVFGIWTVLATLAYLAVDVARILYMGSRIFYAEAWLCAVFLLTGLFGILAGRYRTKGYIASVLAFSIIALILVYAAGSCVAYDEMQYKIYLDNGGALLDTVGDGAKVFDDVIHEASFKDTLKHGENFLNKLGKGGGLTPDLQEEMLQTSWYYMIALIGLGLLIFISLLGLSISACAALCRCCEPKNVGRVPLTQADELALNYGVAQAGSGRSDDFPSSVRGQHQHTKPL